LFFNVIRKLHMLSKIPSNQIYLGDFGWHTGRFHFSFGDYDDPENRHFGDLIAFNDFVVKPGSGFKTHPHNEIEIISYCVEGELTHVDSMGNMHKIKRGDMQYTCAGSGITHSETNDSPARALRFVQIWIQPNAVRLQPHYVSNHFTKEDRLNKLLRIASGQRMNDMIQVNQDTNIFVSEIEAGRQIQAEMLPTRLFYLACLEGSLRINNLNVKAGDAVKIWDETALNLIAIQDSHLIIVEISG
jgi:redox-sensitive bicupin YhaK (pirin superfamily)